ncbi:PREDICTED: cucumber peeling cupredoxin-like [Nelumbo nucifera]|uniref:Phytocyanin domain-containing protein n=2 Tax=Nelumbo nucifera TaxID=4432 RepID=A0A823A1Q8_NELNU|nr:PREDICTED: cucumber peeling cupredoxin-like [Nelumbo nucifera]DAD48088.1 TPA_asm: hypothetical protein HUJ06_018025 [Nelumbo nucifera]
MAAAADMAKLAVVALLITAAAAADTTTPPPYTNHTVGGDNGWFFNPTTNTPATDYTKWAATQTFNLGDYLIFNTNSNQTIIETYNQTTYKNCNSTDALDSDTFIYGESNRIGESFTVAVPLVKVGNTYYFSDAENGVQCQKGMGFAIVVGQGRGLPPSLNQPPPPPYAEPPVADSSQTPPSTVSTGQQERFYNSGFRIRNGANLRIGLLVILSFGLLLA